MLVYHFDHTWYYDHYLKSCVFETPETNWPLRCIWQTNCRFYRPSLYPHKPLSQELETQGYIAGLFIQVIFQHAERGWNIWTEISQTILLRILSGIGSQPELRYFHQNYFFRSNAPLLFFSKKNAENNMGVFFQGLKNSLLNPKNV